MDPVICVYFFSIDFLSEKVSRRNPVLFDPP